MPTTITATTRSRDHNHHHLQRQASAGAGSQLVVVAVLVLDLRIVEEVSRTCYLLRGMPPNTYHPGQMTLVCIYTCFSKDEPWYLVSKPFNITDLRELGTALNTVRKGGWGCYFAAFRNAVLFDIWGVLVAHVTEGGLYVSYDTSRSRARMSDTST